MGVAENGAADLHTLVECIVSHSNHNGTLSAKPDHSACRTISIVIRLSLEMRGSFPLMLLS
jgi:hypothetical protein